MGAVSSVDERFVAAVEEIYLASSAPDRWPNALQAIADCFGDVGAIMIYSDESGQLGTVVSPSLERVQKTYAEGGWWQQDLRFERANERGYFSAIDAITDRHIASESEIRNHPYYVDFLRSQGLQWFGGIGVSPDSRTPAAISVQRALGRPPFSDRELETLVRLGRHAENALRLALKLMNAESAQTVLAETLTRLDVGVFVLSGDGRVLFRNSAASDLLGDALHVHADKLRPADREARARLDAALVGAAASGEDLAQRTPLPILMADPERNRVLAAYLIPCDLRALPSGGGLLLGARVAVVVTKSTPSQPVEPSLTRDLLGLTLAEARVASLIASGMQPRAASEELRLSEITVRTHLKSVFAKTGASRQSDLASLLNKLALRSPEAQTTG